MVQLLADLLDIYPVLESFACQVSYADLLSISRSSSRYRAIFHGLSPPPPDADRIAGSDVRKGLHFGQANTAFWRSLKSKSELVCAESRHTRGSSPQGCRMCSKPVCTACVVKMSFTKHENTFGNRRRALCDDCWASGNPHTNRLHYDGDATISLEYHSMDVCRCTAKEDGILCFECKEQQNDATNRSFRYCSGRGCTHSLREDTEPAGRVCLWCTLTLPGAWRKEKRRRGLEDPYEKMPGFQPTAGPWEPQPPVWPDQRWEARPGRGPRMDDQRWEVRPGRGQLIQAPVDDAPPYNEPGSSPGTLGMLGGISQGTAIHDLNSSPDYIEPGIGPSSIALGNTPGEG